jgi:hypothetical protein
MSKNKNNEFNPYAADKLSRIPNWIKVLFLKYWVAAATFYFFGIGNPIIQSSNIESWQFVLILYLFLSIGLTIFNEYIVDNLVRLMSNDRDDAKRFNLVNQRGILSFLFNVIYGFLIMIPLVTILVFMAKHGMVFDTLDQGDSKAAIEPFTGGFVYILLDSIVVWSRNLISYLIKNKKYQIIEKKNNELALKIKDLTDEEYLEFIKEN